MKAFTYSLILATALSSSALAQPHNHSHSHSSIKTPNQGILTTIIQSMHEPMMKHSPVKSGNANKDFLSNMIPHHQGAILASKEVLKVPNLNPKIRKIAENIIKSQEEEIKLFNSLLSKSLPQTPNKKAYKNFYDESQKTMDSMMDKMNKAYDDNPQKAFLAGMIPHHQGAILASEQILKISDDSKTREIANDIIKEQTKEIAEMENLLKEME
ncbi:DUF305 domain-containing protein [Helicobacter mesocricetorum]|uniref:DUF305 domain-containing protein n=1 Tax=Helicobacter mesocricetorum TaxID=87012 RepID=UPI000CF0A9DE|nr:DUF305 domain-containing protein [Helicobacter mesocricetorum]